MRKESCERSFSPPHFSPYPNGQPRQHFHFAQNKTDLDAINDTTIRHIEWMYDKNKDDGFKDGLACVPEHECHKYQLRCNEDQNFTRGYSHHQQRHYNYNYDYKCARKLVQLLHRCFCIVQRESKGFSLMVGLYLQQPKIIQGIISP